MHFTPVQALQLLTAAGLLESAAAAPNPQAYGQYDPKGKCGNHYIERVDDQKFKRYKEDWEMVTGVSCWSNNDAQCSLSKAYTYTKTTSFSIGGSVGSSKEIGKYGITASFDVGYSWATSKGTSTSSTVNCAKAVGVRCGLMARAEMVEITGTYYKVQDSNYGDCSKDHFDEKPFKGNAALIVGPDPGKEDAAAIEFDGCIAECKDQAACWKAHESGLQLCPGTDKPKDWGKKPDEPKDEPKPDDPKEDPKDGDKDCSKEVGQQHGQCAPELIGKWNCVKGEAWQRCASGTWSDMTPLPAGGWCDCGYKGRDWNPSDPRTNVPL